MDRYLTSVEAALESYLKQYATVPLLKESMAYSLLGGGKRVRPCLTLAVCECLGGEIDSALPLACALEMVHSYSLVHDDLPAMDNDAIRRGKPSTHVRFGEANGILAGDGLLTLAALLCVGSKAPQRAKEELFSAALDMVSGQSLDLNSQAEDIPSLQQIHLYKTGALFRAAVLMGAVCGGETHLEPWRAFAEDLGMLFQITDDILDEEKDKQENRSSYVSLLGREAAKEQAQFLSERALKLLSSYDNEGAAYIRNVVKAMVTREK